MMPSEMLVRVARAISGLGLNDPPTLRGLETAKVAIAAMREPTEDMIMADIANADEHVTFHDAKVVWQAMIDEVLNAQ